MAKHHSPGAWQESREVVIAVLEAGKKHWKPWASAVFDQIQRASLSAQLNIAEGWAFGLSPTCTRHLAIAYGSAVETADLIALMIDAQIVPAELGERLRLHSERSQALLVGLMKQRRPRT